MLRVVFFVLFFVAKTSPFFPSCVWHGRLTSAFGCGVHVFQIEIGCSQSFSHNAQRRTDRETDGRTDRRHYHANSRPWLIKSERDKMKRTKLML